MELYFITFDNNTSTFCKSVGSKAQYVTYCATLQFIRTHTINIFGKDFYLIISSDESTTNFLFSKKVLENNENAECFKCGNAMKLYLHRKGKERRILRCKGKGCQTI